MKEWFGIVRNVLLALVVIAVGELLPPLQALEQWMIPRCAALTWVAAGIAFLGWALLMGATLYRIRTGGGSLSRADIAEQVGRVRSYQAAPMAVFRAWRVMLPKRAWGAGFSDEVSVAQFKAAWRQGLWRQDSRWRGLFIMGIGAALMVVGVLGVVMVLGAPGLKLLFGGALLYAAGRTAWVFVRPGPSRGSLKVVLVGAMLVGCASAAAAMDPVLELAQEQDARSWQKALDAGAMIEPVSRGNSFTVWWQPAGFDPAKDITFVSLHGHAGWATKDFTIWHPVIRERGYALLTVQWWYGRSMESIGYAKPEQIYRWIAEALQAHGVTPGRVIFEGFSMGGANCYAVTLIDHLSPQPYFAVTIANAGAMEADYPPNQGLLDDRHGERPLTGTRWILYCSQHDEQRERACDKMAWTDQQLRRAGGKVELFLKDEQGGHGGFMQPRMHTQALDLAERLLTGGP